VTQLLSDLSPGQAGKVVSVGGSKSFRRRVQEMGVVSGNTVKVLSSAPFGDPIQLWVPHYRLAIRRAEAGQVAVEIEP